MAQSKNDQPLGGDAIDKIADLVRQAQRPPFLVRPGDAQGHVHALQPDGSYLLQENVREPTAITLPSPAAFVEYATKHLKPNSEIYVGDNEVVLIYDAEDYRGDAARCSLLFSDQFNILSRWHVTPEKMSQADLIRYLRVSFHNCVPSSTVTLFRTLELKAANEARSHIGHGAESLGKSITAKVTGAAEIPDEITFTVPVWENYRPVREIRCVLDLDPHLMQFKLTPVASAIAQAQEALELTLLDYLKTELAQNTDAIYRGTFSA